MIKKYLGIFLILLAIVFSIYWLNISPTINPNNIKLTGYLINAKELDNHKFFKEYNHALTIKLNNKSGMKVYSDDYCSNIYVYIDDFIIREPYDSWKLEKRGFDTSVKQSFTVLPVRDKLKELGITFTKNVSVPALHGLMYTDNVFPAKIQYYITNVKYKYSYGEQKTKQKPNLNNSYLVYSHYEKKWGKDLSWVKVFEIKDKVDE